MQKIRMKLLDEAIKYFSGMQGRSLKDDDEVGDEPGGVDPTRDENDGTIDPITQRPEVEEATVTPTEEQMGRGLADSEDSPMESGSNEYEDQYKMPKDTYNTYKPSDGAMIGSGGVGTDRREQGMKQPRYPGDPGMGSGSQENSFNMTDEEIDELLRGWGG